jgi:hypothetical protein
MVAARTPVLRSSYSIVVHSDAPGRTVDFRDADADNIPPHFSDDEVRRLAAT